MSQRDCCCVEVVERIRIRRCAAALLRRGSFGVAKVVLLRGLRGSEGQMLLQFVLWLCLGVGCYAAVVRCHVACYCRELLFACCRCVVRASCCGVGVFGVAKIISCGAFGVAKVISCGA